MNIQNFISWEYVVEGYDMSTWGLAIFDPKKVTLKGSKVIPQALSMEYREMTRKKGSNNVPTTYNTLKWINSSLTREHQSEISGWGVDDGELFSALIMLVDTGHSIAIKVSPDGAGYMATAIGLGMSGFAPTPRDAFKVLLFKHHAIFGGQWPQPEEGEKPLFR